MAVTVNCKGTLTIFSFSSKTEDQVDDLVHHKVRSIVQRFSVSLEMFECGISTVQSISGP